MKKGCTILFLILVSITYGQHSTLIKNINIRAQGLKHDLNKTNDSLLIESDELIYKIDIFNDDFEKSYAVKDNKASIALKDIPVGRFITEVEINNKLIIITLIRHKVYEELIPIKTPEPAVVQTEKLPELNQRYGKEDIVSAPKKPVKFYWIERQINKGPGSSKYMRIGDKEIVDKMIIQHKIDKKSITGKNNVLTVWEVYDARAFIRYKKQNSNYANTKDKKVTCFNSVPIYASGT
ncbi:hypothetical protein [uncultured Winogradskyella sp.]|uniref:hypothetical protein n=1 Tax=uncultured Winogradskyella sp. TaxID=395353 RepID=UPI002625BDBB|nr:hypothetical protein [uncultured Winogradskyella sp.]